ncbi:zinc-binding alcohol dehydrogenase family protein [Paenibacillus mendelii]|uniref:Zinc-binding alcohol dehydrogenase family protein n=1 Tax=Paenibacillus mendelii TaxID=206163 RepID=A0ABV6J9E6_9BACL|nr:zinc-binding alcohol dehydrogenase family protein [Paenibacillus mendelii]MCQ6559836.1 zinc-binding alcohol dehydrogenase family protein [Paenibacillus mendelii]
MKGIICEQIERFTMVEMEEPPAPNAGEAVVRIRRIGICGTDLHAYRGNQPFFSYPRVLGHELAGIVEAVGEHVTGVREGDQVSVIPYMECGHCVACRNGKTNCCTDMKVLGVHIDGGMRERMTLPADHLIVTNGLTLDQAAILEPFSIGAHALRRSELRKGETVLVIGGGPIGLGVMALAKQQGARVIAMDVKDDRLAFCREWAGADHTVNAQQEPIGRLRELTDGEFPTVVFDATGNMHSMNDSFQFVAHGGKLVFVGLVKADITFHDPEFHKRELTLLASRNATRADFDTVMVAVRDGSIDVSRYITHRVGFVDMIDQFEGWMQPGAGVIKAMVEL